MSGKGSAPRPISVSGAEYRDKWYAVFGKPLEEGVKWEQLELDLETPEVPDDKR